MYDIFIWISLTIDWSKFKAGQVHVIYSAGVKCLALETKIVNCFSCSDSHLLIYFHLQITQATVTGQCLDMTVSPPAGTVDFSNYTLDKYNAIVKWKTAFYSFYLPAAVAMYMV